MPSFGLDISDKSIKYVELKRHSNTLKLGRFGEIILPEQVISSGKIQDPKKLADKIFDLRKSLNLPFVRLTLPEEQIYLFTISIPKIEPEQIRGTIELSLEQYVPLPTGEAIFDYDLIKEEESAYILQVAAISGFVVGSYVDLCKSAKMTPACFELEGSPLARALIKYGDTKTYMLIDFGDARTGIIITTGHRVLFSTTVPLGGTMLTQLIAKNFGVKVEEAETLKREHGLSRDVQNAELFNTIIGGVSVLKDEIYKNYDYWNTHKDEIGNVRPPIEKIILSGGNANLIGITEYLEASLKIPVVLGDVWLNMRPDGKIGKDYLPAMNFEESLSYAMAIGLALGDFEQD